MKIFETDLYLMLKLMRILIKIETNFLLFDKRNVYLHDDIAIRFGGCDKHGKNKRYEEVIQCISRPQLLRGTWQLG